MQKIEDLGLKNNDELMKRFSGRIKSMLGNIQNQDRRLVIDGVTFGKANYDPDDWNELHEALVHKKTVGVPYYVNARLVDNNDGHVIDQKKLRVGVLPLETKLNTFVINGSSYNIPLQFRLKAGAYPRISNAGQVETFHNVDGGLPMRTQVDPEKKTVSLRVRQGSIPMIGILQLLGATEAEMIGAMGKEVYDANKDSDPEVVLRKAYRTIFKKNPPDHQAVVDELRAYFARLSTYADVNKITLGNPHESVDKGYFLDSIKKTIGIIKGDEDQSNRDNLAFKHVLGATDVFDDTMSRYEKRNTLTYKGKMHLPGATRIEDVIDRNKIDKTVRQFFSSSQITRFADQTNPVAMAVGPMTTTLLGEGGVGSQDLVTDDAKEVQNSSMGFLDLLHTPECHDDKTMVFTDSGWKYFNDLAPEDKLACKINERLEFHRPLRLIAEYYRGPMYGATSRTLDYLVTPNHRMWSRCSQPLRDGSKCAFTFHSAEHCHKMNRSHSVTHNPYEGESIEYFEIPFVRATENGFKKIPTRHDPVAWASFMGWYLSEGCFSINLKTHNYHTCISQSRTANPRKCLSIESVLNKLGFHWAYTSGGDYVIDSKQLTTYMSQFGHSNNKWIPEEFFSAPTEVRQALLDALIAGDGKIGNKRSDKPKWNTEHQYRIFFSASKLLADGVERLAISLGYPTSRKVRPDNRKDTYFDIHEISLLLRTEVRAYPKHYYTVDYDGMVYCAEVPGGLLFTKRNSHPLWSGNSSSGGITLTLTKDTMKTKDGLKTKVINVFNGKDEWLSPQQLQDTFLAYPEELVQKNGKWVSPDNEVWGVVGDKITSVKPHAVKYMLSSPAGMFDIASLSTPFMHSNQGNRLLTSAKMATQAVPVLGKEKPLVDIDVDGELYSDMLGEQASIHSPVSGVVESVTAKEVIIVTPAGKEKVPLFHNMPLNEKNFLDSAIRVKPGDKIKKGDLLADSNYTVDGKYAPGANLTTAYVPWKGLNYNDACVITQSAADKLSSEHLHKITMPLKSDSVLDIRKFLATSPYGVSPENLGKYDPDGIIKPGTEVGPGDTLIAAIKKHSPRNTDIIIQRMKKSALPKFDDDSMDWKKLSKGIVTDVHKSPSEITVYVKSREPFRVGDKLTGRHGNKMIVSDIIPDDMAPTTESGEKIDIIIDPLSVPSRINTGQMLETAAGKIAAKTGSTFVVKNFDRSHNYHQEILDMMAKSGIPEKEDIYDPETGKTLPKVFTGKQYIYKLKHQAEFKQSRRGLDDGYTIDETPTSGKGQGGMTIDNLTGNVLLAHNARDFLRESMTIKNNRNADYWGQIIKGEIPQPPQNVREWDKFNAYLKGMGINPVQNKNKIKLTPLTDADALALSTGEIKSPSKMFLGRGEDILPEKDGLFGTMADSVHGKNFTHINLAETIANPTYKEAIKSILKVTDKEYDELLEK